MKINPLNSEGAMQRLFNMSAAQDLRLVSKWPNQLPDLFKSAGGRACCTGEVSRYRPCAEYCTRIERISEQGLVEKRGSGGGFN